MDLLGPFNATVSGHTHVLVTTDYFTKWVSLFPLKAIDAGSVAVALRQLFCRFGAPRQLISDQGKQFTAGVVQELLGLLGIRHSTTTAYHPQSDGLTERFNATLQNMLTPYVNDDRNNWDAYLDAVAFAYNTSRHDTTKFSPYFLLFGREAALPIVEHVRPPQPSSPGDALAFRKTLDTQLMEARERALTAIQVAQKKQTADYNQRHRPVVLQVGDSVLVKQTPPQTGSTKLHRPWSEPHTVVAREGQNYTVRRDGREQLVHVQRLRPYVARPIQTAATPRPQALADGSFRVDRLIGRRKRNGRSMYRVLWAGYPVEDATWEPAANVDVALRKQFDQEHRRK